MFGLPRIQLWATIGAIVVAMALTIAGLIYRAGYTSNENDKLKDTVKAHETSDRISSEVDQMGLVARCLELGGLPDKCDELRGLDTSPEDQRPGGARRQ